MNMQNDLDIIPIELANKENIDLRAYPTYQTNGNVIQETPGVRTNQDFFIFFDVTKASEEFKAQHANIIMKLQNVSILSHRNNSQLDTPLEAKSASDVTLMPFHFIHRDMLETLKDCPLYEIRREGILEVEHGHQMSNNAILAYDISATSEEFKSKHITLGMNNVKRLAPNDNSTLTLIETDENYISLNNDIKKLLGNNFVCLENTEKGIKVKPVLTTINHSGTIYLAINPARISPEILNSLNTSIQTISLNDSGLYDVVEKEDKQKKL